MPGELIEPPSVNLYELIEPELLDDGDLDEFGSNFGDVMQLGSSTWDIESVVADGNSFFGRQMSVRGHRGSAQASIAEGIEEAPPSPPKGVDLLDPAERLAAEKRKIAELRAKAQADFERRQRDEAEARARNEAEENGKKQVSVTVRDVDTLQVLATVSLRLACTVRELGEATIRQAGLVVMP